MVDPAGNGATVAYDAENRPADYNDGDGNHTLVSYYGDNCVNEITDPNLVKTQFNYYLSQGFVTETHALGTSDQLVYKSTFDATGMTDKVYVGATELGATRLLADYDYDLLDRIDIVKDGLGHATDYDFDKASQLIQVKDALNKITTLAWDALGRNVAVTDGRQSCIRFARPFDLMRIIRARKRQNLAYCAVKRPFCA